MSNENNEVDHLDPNLSMGELMELPDELLDERILNDAKVASEVVTEDVKDEDIEVDTTVAEVPDTVLPEQQENSTTTEEIEEVGEVKVEEQTYEVLTKDNLKGKKARVKYNGEESELDADELIGLAQIGMHAGAQDYKKALATNKALEAAGISQDDIAMMARLKSGDPGAMKDIIARNDLNLDDMYDIDQVDIDTAKANYKPTEVNVEWDSYTGSLDRLVVDKFDTIQHALPGLSAFNARVNNSKNTTLLSGIVDNVKDGTWNDIASSAVTKYLALPESEKALLATSDAAFMEFYNPLIDPDAYQQQGAQSGTVTSAVQNEVDDVVTPPANKPVSQRASAADVDQKMAMGKPSNTPVVPSLVKPKKTAQEIYQEIYDMDEHEEAQYFKNLS